jgi:hypothetical protein
MQQLFGRTKSKYRELYADGEMRVYENTEALPRAFLVDQARLSPSVGASLGEMIHRPFEPRQEVILAADNGEDVLSQLTSITNTGAPSTPGTASVKSYSPNEVRVATNSPAAALLVLSDTYYPGWRALVDGREQPLVRGDLLFRVVPVPAGQHEVVFRFEPTSIRVGLAITVVALLVAAAGLALASRAHARRRTTSAEPASRTTKLIESRAGDHAH